MNMKLSVSKPTGDTAIQIGQLQTSIAVGQAAHAPGLGRVPIGAQCTPIKVLEGIQEVCRTGREASCGAALATGMG